MKKCGAQNPITALDGALSCAYLDAEIDRRCLARCYVYYHCTGYADKCQGNPPSCRRRYVREELLENSSPCCSAGLQFDDEVLVWVRDALHASHAEVWVSSR